MNGWRPRIEGDAVRIYDGQTFDSGKPEPAIARLASGRLTAAAAFQARQAVGAGVAEAVDRVFLSMSNALQLVLVDPKNSGPATAPEVTLTILPDAQD